MPWQPRWAAWPEGEGTRFRVWAPSAQRVELVLEPASRALPMEKSADGCFSLFSPDVRPGQLYRYRLDGQGPFPDPAARFQPQGVHGPSEVIDTRSFAWSDASWRGLPLEQAIIYELHVGTFSPAGTFAGVTERLPYLAELGVTALELMPVADFPGQRNWGYDGVDLFAPARCYGRPDDLRRLVDGAHRLGLAVLLDVVYNHLGPDGNYLGRFSPFYFSSQPTTWGKGLNFDGDHSSLVREFFIENALHWIHEYHLDGLRLDATHVIVDRSPRHILAEMADRLRAATPERRLLLIAEDPRNLAAIVKPAAENGWGLDAVWADDFHHQVRRLLAGDHESYYCDYTGRADDLARTLRQGWLYCGQHSAHRNRPRGTDPAGIPFERFVWCIQNHDQVGNRALGERLHHQVEPAAWRAATALLLCAPPTPLLFMGQEWAASSPFRFFTDHHVELGKKVTEGRRREFKSFFGFSNPEAQRRIPDPQRSATFEASRLIWEERERPPHAGTLRLYQALLRLRREEPALRSTRREDLDAAAIGDDALAFVRRAAGATSFLAVFQLRGSGAVDLRQSSLREGLVRRWELILTTEDTAFCPDPAPPRLDLSASAPVIDFARPGAVLLRAAAI